VVVTGELPPAGADVAGVRGRTLCGSVTAGAVTGRTTRPVVGVVTVVGVLCGAAVVGTVLCCVAVVEVVLRRTAVVGVVLCWPEAGAPGLRVLGPAGAVGVVSGPAVVGVVAAPPVAGVVGDVAGATPIVT
jgi:hypothetical protein